MREIFAIVTDTDFTCLAIESGGSGTRIALAGPDATILHEAHCASASPLYRNRDTFSDEFSACLEGLLNTNGLDRKAIQRIGLAGPADVVALHTLLETALPGVPRLEHSEGEVGLGYYGLTEGIALVVGTGASCHAIDAHGKRSAIGGYGPQFGDEGSAYWIGREGLRAAFRAEQGRIEPTALLDAALDFYQVSSPWDLLDEATEGGNIGAPRIAEFAAIVNATADASDPRARDLLMEAGHHLGTLILDMVSRTQFEVVSVPLVMTGGVLRSKAVLSSIESTLSEAPAVFSFHPVVFEPITGLIRLLQLDMTVRT